MVRSSQKPRVAFCPTGPEKQKHGPLVAVFFWSVNLLFFILAIAVRLTSSPSPYAKTLFYSASGGQTVPAVRADLVGRLTLIAETPLSDAAAFNDHIVSLDTYLQTLLHLALPPTAADSSVSTLSQIRKLKTVTEHWVLKRTPYISPADMQKEILSFKPLFADNPLSPFFQPESPVYRYGVRGATGLLEGIGSPVILCWRAGKDALSGTFRAQTLFDPPDWRRGGWVFLLTLFYGSLLCTYACAWFAMTVGKNFLFIPGLISLVYSLEHLALFVLRTFG